MAAAGAAVNNTNEKVIFRNCAPFTDCITKTRDNVLLDPEQRLFNLLNNLIFEKVNFGPKM